jgi:hypothetical protein
MQLGKLGVSQAPQYLSCKTLDIRAQDNQRVRTEKQNWQTGYCPIIQRDDGLFQIGWHDDAPGPFPTRQAAAAVADVPVR